MKLLNREPTEEMIQAACAVKGMSISAYKEWWVDHFQAMYDAAPEIVVCDHEFDDQMVCKKCKKRWVDIDHSAEQLSVTQSEIATNSEPIGNKLVQDMEPVAYIALDNYEELQLTDCSGKAVYSAEQVAAMQAENEELKDRNKQGAASADTEITMLARELADVTADRDHWKELSHEDYWKQVQKLTAERDELLECGMELILEAEEYEFDDGMGKGALMQSWNDFEAVAFRIESTITK